MDGVRGVAATNRVEPRLSLATTGFGHEMRSNSQVWRARYARALLFTDALCVVSAVALAQYLRFGGSEGTGRTYASVSLVVAAMWMAALSINNSRSERVIGSGAEEYRRVWLGTASVFGAVAVTSMMLKLEIARGYLMIAMPTGALLLIGSRWLARRLVAREREKYGHFMSRVLVVGCASAATDLISALSRDRSAGYSVVGAIIHGSKGQAALTVPGVGAIPTYGDQVAVLDAVAETQCDSVAVAATDRLHGQGIKELSWELEKLDIELLVAPGVVDVAGPRLHMRPMAGLPLIYVEKPQYHGAKRFQKRLFDISFSATVLVLAAPIFLAVALAIKLTSRGPVFYRQERIGLNGEAFEMIKFRTMVDGADAMLNRLVDRNDSPGGVLFKMREDPRVTPVGRYLRRFSVDEIPQFINVLKGQMSVVGPRPPLPTEVAAYDHQVMRRLLVRPGITGLWQVSGRSDLSWEDSVRLDLFYVENWSMVADFVIALKTARVMISQSGAY
jgi:exopolysaccharide biosynthesis polyprenyl glycosylphosphotransferase